MPQESFAESPARGGGKFLSTHAQLIEWLLARTAAARWGVTRARFATALERSAVHHFRGRVREAEPTDADVAAYLASLHVEDLALACACSDANEQAWEHFVLKYREDLYAAARAIVGLGAGEARARELADSLYAELYMGGASGSAAPKARTDDAGQAGMPPLRGRTLFDYFHGRSKLSTWLRAVLAQRHVDAFRASRRMQSLEANDSDVVGSAELSGTLKARHPGPRTGADPPDPDRARYLSLLQAALLDALAALDPRERMRLAYYYVHEHTLAEIGRILDEHEATVSRKLDRTRQEVRRNVERALREGPVSTGGDAPAGGLSDAQVHLCFEYALEEYPFDLARALTGVPGFADSGTKRGDE